MPSGLAHAADNEPPEKFAATFVESIRSNKQESLLEIIHPSSRACITPETQAYYNWIFKRRAKYASAGGFKISAALLDANAIDEKSPFPVRPTHQLQIDFDDDPLKSITVVVLILNDKGRWWEVLPCPRGDDVARVTEAERQNDQRERAAHRLISEMPAELRTELHATLKAGRRVEAIMRFSSASGQDITMSKSVITLLEESVSR